MIWITKHFKDLSVYELYAIIQLRNEVFVVEQNCVFQDADDKDQASWHLMGLMNGVLVAYARLIPEGVAFAECSIGRVITSPSYRGKGTGRVLVLKAIEECRSLFNDIPIRIGAQLYLEKFYGSLGFLTSGEIYLEDGIQHVEMVRS